MKKKLFAPDFSRDTIHRIEEALQVLSSQGDQLQDHQNQKITRFQVGSLDLVAKEYEITSTSRKIAAHLGYSRARRSFRAGLRLLQAGIKTPQPVLLIEDGSPFFSKSIRVTEFAPGVTLDKSLASGETPPASLAADLDGILRKLLEIHFRHGDFHGLNLIVSPTGTASLIDLDSARRRFFKRRITTNIQADRDRLIGSSAADPEFQKSLMEILGEPGTPFPRL